MEDEYMLTTIDNPFNPFSDFDRWYQYDEQKGYHSCSLLARIAKTTSELSESDNRLEINRAIDEIIKYDPLNIYIRAYRV